MARRGHGEGSIYQRADGRWTAAISLRDGKRKSFYGKTRRDVQQKLGRALRDQEQGLPAVPERLTVAQYLEQWLGSVRTSVRAKTYETYDLNVRRVRPHLGGRRLAALTAMDIQGCYAALLAQGLSRRSVRQSHEMLHRAMHQAVEWGLLARNPTDAASPPRPERQEMQTLTEPQVQHLFAATTADRYHPLWVLLVTTGLRLGEATGLRWEDVDLTNGTLTVRRALQRRRNAGLVFVEPKTAGSRRTVHLVAGTVRALREHRRRQVEDRLAAGADWQDHDLVFTQAFGRPLAPETVTDALQRALQHAGLPRVRVHDLRHTAATLLLVKGVHPKVVQEMLGHSTISITLDLYSHVLPTMHREAVQRLEALF